MILPGQIYYKSIKTIPVFAFVLKSFLKDSGIDILHSHLVDSITGACMGAFFDRTPHVGTLHDVHTLEEKPYKIKLLQLAAALGTKLIVVSHDIHKYIFKKSRFLKGAYITIPNGIDINKFAHSGETRDLKSILNLEEKDFVFISVGRLVNVKDHSSLIRAFSKCKFDHNVKLLIVGDGALKESITRQIVTLKLEGSVKMLGLRNDIPDLLNISDCFVLSSRSEGLSCSIIEAMAAGLPSIVTNVGGNPELIEDGKNGYLVPVNNPSALAAQMKKVYDNINERESMGKYAMRIVREKYSIDIMCRNYILVYEKMVKKIK